MFESVRQVHRWNGLGIGVFVVLHFATHLLAWGGIALHTNGLKLARLLYRTPVIEVLLLTALLLQILVGLLLVLARVRTGKLTGWGVLQILSGIILALFVLAHVSANLSARFQYGLDTNFFWPAATLVQSPMNRYFYFHYTVPVCALFAHVACALRFNGLRRHSWLALAAGPIAALVIILPFTGALYPIELPAAHRAYLEAALAPHLGATTPPR